MIFSNNYFKRRFLKKIFQAPSPIIEEAIRKLPNGNTRLSASGFDYYDINQYSPDYSEQQLPDYKEIEKNYFEEVAAIEKILIDMNIPIPFQWWEENTQDKSGNEYRITINRRACAMEMWDRYGIPYRYKNGLIYMIRPSSDVIINIPTIYSYNIQTFLTGLTADQETKDKILCVAERKRKLWETIGAILILLILLILGIISL